MIAVDICNTCANLQPLLVQRFGECTMYPLPVPKDFWSSPEAIDLYSKATPLENAAVFFNKQNHDHDGIIYVTNRPIQAEFITHRWLHKHGFPRGKIIFCKREHKAEVYLSLKPSMIAEDDPKVAIKVAETGIPVLMFQWPYNSDISHKRIHKVNNRWHGEEIRHAETH